MFQTPGPAAGFDSWRAQPFGRVLASQLSASPSGRSFIPSCRIMFRICARWCGLPTIPSLACTMRSHAHSAPAVATVRAR